MPEIASDQQPTGISRVSMALLILQAVADLLFYDLLIRFAGFAQVRARVKKAQVRNRPTNSRTTDRVCVAADIASCFYYKQVRCMHRSFVTVRLLRKCGVNADLVIGSRPVPFLCHAWVEVDGRIVNDKQGYKRRLCVLERM
jgi:hypothetical protein